VSREERPHDPRERGAPRTREPTEGPRGPERAAPSTTTRELCEAAWIAVEQLVAARAHEHARGAVTTRAVEHLDLHPAAGPRERRGVDACEEPRQSRRSVLGRDPHDLAREVRLERAQVRPVVSWALEVERHGEHALARARAVLYGEREQRRGVHAASREHGDGGRVAHRCRDRGLERGAKVHGRILCRAERRHGRGGLAGDDGTDAFVGRLIRAERRIEEQARGERAPIKSCVRGDDVGKP
jgi:hypothetical protein